MKYDTLKALVNAKVYENTEQRITGGDMNAVLQSAIASLGAHYQMGGLVSPTDHITVGDEPVVFIATTPGTYTYFGSQVVADGEVALLVWSGTAWSKQTPDIATRTEVSQLAQEKSEQDKYILDNINSIFSGKELTIKPSSLPVVDAVVIGSAYYKQGRTSLLDVSGLKEVIITTSYTGYIVFIKSISSLSPEEGSYVNFATGESGRRSYESGTHTFEVPQDAAYALVLCQNSSYEDVSPSAISIVPKEAVSSRIFDGFYSNVTDEDNLKTSGRYVSLIGYGINAPRILCVYNAGASVYQTRLIFSNSTGTNVQFRTYENSSWSEWSDVFAKADSNKLFSDSYDWEQLDSIVRGGIYRVNSNTDAYGFSFLLVRKNGAGEPNPNYIYQTRFTIGIAGAFSIATRSSSDNGVTWTTWANAFNVPPGFTGVYEYTEIDNIKTAGIYRIKEASLAYGFNILLVRNGAEMSVSHQLVITSSMAGVTTIRSRTFDGTSWSAWSDYSDELIARISEQTEIVTYNNYKTISDTKNELLSCEAMMQPYNTLNSKNKQVSGFIVAVYQADETNTEENEFLGTAITKLSFFNIFNPNNATQIEVAKANDVKDGYSIGAYSPYDCNLLVTSDTTALCWFRINGLLNSSCKMCVCDVNLVSKSCSNYRDMTLDGETFNEDAMISAYQRLTGITLSHNQLYPIMTGNVVLHDGKFYTYLGGSSAGASGVDKRFGGILLSSTNGADWESVLAQDLSSLSGSDKEIGEGVIAIDETNNYLYICGRNFYSSAAHCIQSVYNLSDWSIITPPSIISDGGVSSKPMCVWLNNELYLWVQGAQNPKYNARRNSANIYKVTLPSCQLTKVKGFSCPEGCASPSLLSYGNSIYATFQTDARGLRLTDQARSNIAFMRIY